MLLFFVITMQFPYLHPRRILRIHKEYALCIMLLLYALVLMVPLGLYLPFSSFNHPKVKNCICIPYIYKIVHSMFYIDRQSESLKLIKLNRKPNNEGVIL